jgi:hypothetical protein
MGAEYVSREEAGKALIEACKLCKADQILEVGSYKGFDMSIYYETFNQKFVLELKREESGITYRTTLGKQPNGNIDKINAELKEIPYMLANSQEQLKSLQDNFETARGEVGKPFPQEELLKAKQIRLAEVTKLIEEESKKDKETEVDEVADPVQTKSGEGEQSIAADSLPNPLTANLGKQDKKSLADRFKKKREQMDKINEDGEKPVKPKKNRHEEL